MRRPESLIGTPIRGSFICESWELRITARCLANDLGAASDSAFDDVSGLEIIRALVRERTSHADGGREVAPISCGVPIWVIAHQHRHRGATWHDEEEEVIWLVAYGAPRSGDPDDFYPWCMGLADADCLLPTQSDLEELYRDRDARFVDAVTVEAPLVLQRARRTPGEHTHYFGGALDSAIALEVEPELPAEAITVAFRPALVEWDLIPIVLAALYPSDEWADAPRMPSRDLAPGEVAMTITLG